MKLDVGMYCYNKTNRKLGIGKIIDFQSNNNVNIRYKNDIELVSIGNVIASFNIIDILDVGDYVNGFPVIHKENDILKCGLLVQFKENDIKSIVTHEQMEQIAYKVSD